MIFVLILIVVGIVNKQPQRYWGHVVVAIATQIITTTLFAGGGTLQDPSKDGIITQIIRNATNDGPIVGLLIIPAICFGWLLPIWIVRKGFKPKMENKNLNAINN